MSGTPTRSIALTPVLETYLRDQVASGRYSSASEVVRNGLRLLMEQDERRQGETDRRSSKDRPA